MNRLLLLLSYMGLSISGLLVFLFVSEIIDFIQRPEVYKQVYRFGEYSSHWKFRNDSTFVLWNLFTSLIGIGYIFLSLLYLFKFKKSTKLRYFLLVFECLFITYSINFYYHWYLSGFDHF